MKAACVGGRCFDDDDDDDLVMETTFRGECVGWTRLRLMCSSGCVWIKKKKKGQHLIRCFHETGHKVVLSVEKQWTSNASVVCWEGHHDFGCINRQ